MLGKMAREVVGGIVEIYTQPIFFGEAEADVSLDIRPIEEVAATYKVVVDNDS